MCPPPPYSFLPRLAVFSILYLKYSHAHLHTPPNLCLLIVIPPWLQVGVFDTGYHRTLPDYAYTYPLPSNLATKYRRYGFHGTSHKYVVEQAARFLGKEKINAISFHLGLFCMVVLFISVCRGVSSMCLLQFHLIFFHVYK